MSFFPNAIMVRKKKEQSLKDRRKKRKGKERRKGGEGVGVIEKDEKEGEIISKSVKTKNNQRKMWRKKTVRSFG